jgi:hypothetical protein
LFGCEKLSEAQKHGSAPVFIMPKALGLILRRERRLASFAGAKNNRFEQANNLRGL